MRKRQLSRKGVHKHGTIKVSLCGRTAALVRSWQRGGVNVSEMVRHAVLSTFPAPTTKDEATKYLKAMKTKRAQEFEDYRKTFERDMRELNAKIREVEKDDDDGAARSNESSVPEGTGLA